MLTRAFLFNCDAGMVSPKPTDSSKGKQGLDRSGAVACQHQSSFQGECRSLTWIVYNVVFVGQWN